MHSIVAWKDIRIAGCFVVAFAACGYEPSDIEGITVDACGVTTCMRITVWRVNRYAPTVASVRDRIVTGGPA